MIYSWFFNKLEEAEYYLFIKLLLRMDPIIQYSVETLKYVRPEIFIEKSKQYENNILQEHRHHYYNLINKLENYLREK